jgi:hypothetical protein
MQIQQEDTMNHNQHIKRHQELHQAIDELASDYLIHNPGCTLGSTSIITLLQWSYQQTQNPVGCEQDIEALKRQLAAHLN